MTTTQLDIQTDYYAKSDSLMFPLAEKLSYYNEADGILNALIIDQQEDTGESEEAADTVPFQNDYEQPDRIHHINWLKLNYGNGFIPARYKKESDLITEYGNDYDTYLSQYADTGSPIYTYQGKRLSIYPAPNLEQAGKNRMVASIETIPTSLDRVSNDTPSLVPENFHYLHSAYAAKSWLDEDDPLWAKNEQRWKEGVQAMLATMFPTSRQEEMIIGLPYDTGHNY